jgi:hypothetical protein
MIDQVRAKAPRGATVIPDGASCGVSTKLT